MKYPLLLLVLLSCTGCILTPREDVGPGGTVYNIRIDQDGGDHATAKIKEHTATGGINLFIGSYERDKALNTNDDNSQAKNATANDELKVTP